MSRRISSDDKRSNIVRGSFQQDLAARRHLQLDLPAFLVCALEARVAEANYGALADEYCTMDHYIESELVNLITLRDVAELEGQVPGLAKAVQDWINQMRE